MRKETKEQRELRVARAIYYIGVLTKLFPPVSLTEFNSLRRDRQARRVRGLLRTYVSAGCVNRQVVRELAEIAQLQTDLLEALGLSETVTIQDGEWYFDQIVALPTT